MVSIAQQAHDPDFLARQVGVERYDSKVGNLRRHELYRLGNAWGMNFPAGATKDHMLPYFRQMEAEGKDPFKPPRQVPIHPEFSAESHIEPLTFDNEGRPLNGAEPARDPEPEADDLRTRLEALTMGELKALTKKRGLPQSNKDKRGDLIDRILESELGQDAS